MKSLWTLIILSFSLSMQAQESDPVLLKVYYKFTHVHDTTMPDKPNRERLVLEIGPRMTRYSSTDQARFDSINRIIGENQFKTSRENGGTPMIDARAFKKATRDQFFQRGSDTNKEIWMAVPVRASINTPEEIYLFQDNVKTIQWELTDESKNIKGITCQKAIGSFRGRIYEAWFSAAYPYSVGPWKLSGLPGLILEASDTKREVIFELDTIEKAGDQQAIIRFPAGAIKTSAKEFKQMVEGMITSMFGSPVGNVNGMNMKRKLDVGGFSNQLPTFNNPIERSKE